MPFFKIAILSIFGENGYFWQLPGNFCTFKWQFPRVSDVKTVNVTLKVTASRAFIITEMAHVRLDQIVRLGHIVNTVNVTLETTAFRTFIFT